MDRRFQYARLYVTGDRYISEYEEVIKKINAVKLSIAINERNIPFTI
jgi:hypothetical protein